MWYFHGLPVPPVPFTNTYLLARLTAGTGIYSLDLQSN